MPRVSFGGEGETRTPTSETTGVHSTVSDALRTLSHGLAQWAEALDAGADADLLILPLLSALSPNGHLKGHSLGGEYAR